MERMEWPMLVPADCRLEARNQAVVLPERSRNED
jgi:hypothetical protein